MTIDTLDKVVAALSVGNMKKDVFKPSMTSKGAGLWQSLWMDAGFPIAAATPPAYNAGSGYIPTNATDGALKFTNSLITYLLQASLSNTVVGKLILYDRLWHCSGMVTNVIQTLSITTPGNVNRGDVNGVGVEAWCEIYGAPGATGANWTLTYTNTASQSHTSVYAHPASAEAVGQMMPFTLQAGDLGVISPTSVAFSASSGTAGSIGITLLRRLAEIPFPIVNTGTFMDFAALGMPKIEDNACLAMMLLCSAATSGIVQGSFVLGQG